MSIARFAMGKFEVTRGQYRVFAQATSHAGCGCFFWNGAAFELDGVRSWQNTGYA